MIDESILIGGNHLANYLLSEGIDPAQYRHLDYYEFMEMKGQKAADVFIAWKAIMVCRDTETAPKPESITDEVERVAQAICPWYGSKVSDETIADLWENLAPERKNGYRQQARAAILAMRPIMPVSGTDIAEIYVPEGYVLVSLDSQKRQEKHEEFKNLFVTYLDWNNAQEIYSPHGSGRMVPILCHKPLAKRLTKQESSNG